jgi:predicted nucleic acid-binding protein
VIVVDSNVLAYFYLPGDFTAEAQALFERDPDWVAPVLWRSEFRNILAGYLRRGSLSFEEAVRIQAEAEDQMAGAEFAVDSLSVLGLVCNSSCTAYDCEFVALANELDTRLVTMDRKLLQAFPDRVMALRGD